MPWDLFFNIQHHFGPSTGLHLMFIGKIVSNPDNLLDILLHFSPQYKGFGACKLQDALQEQYAVISA